MSEPVYLLKKMHKDAIKAVLEKYELTEDDFERTSNGAYHSYKFKLQKRLYFVFQQHINDLEKFLNTCTTFTPNFTPKDYKATNGIAQSVRIEGAVERFEYWLKSDLIPYINETSNLIEKRKFAKKNLQSLEDHSAPPLDNFYEPLTKEELQSIGKKKEFNSTDIVHSDIHGRYTLPQLIKEYDKLVYTNIKYGNRQTELVNELGLEKFKNQSLEQQLEKKLQKTLPGIIYLISSFLFLSYVIGTIHYHLKLTFNPLIFFTVETLLLILGMIVWFKDGTERRNLIAQLVVGIFLILAGLVAYKLFT